MNHPDKIEVAGSGMKNRYRTIIPNEHSRVKLPEINQDPVSSYINANYIRGYRGEPNAFIATQGPMSNTVEDFWRMVWHEKAPIIVMITKLREKNRVRQSSSHATVSSFFSSTLKSKCESYIPENYSVFGDFEVIVRSISDKDGFILRQLSLKYLNEEHRIWHYWYTAWPDHKAPNTARQLLELVRAVDQQRASDTSQQAPACTGPTIVHCSAGIGRTGCFIATSVGMQQLQRENSVDILYLLSQMRLDRGGMVQTNEQYEFIHHALALYERELPERPAFLLP
ncbi:hypothetical protein CAPTEDRAFT_168672 [Capitella teleta]|uniref:protein-tyrosine-phosphatase n=1 Tax=Capitella teleta TaxID=283909 RepID=R7UKA8_CAPTE|nr:hypothetical protein CAPTEDRAFT_168672 [Capitella teleta]|eukprot:ELU06625.1 hypothetical protein CAPTEDRAFT_168672 [Capitella teleta]